MSSRLTKGRQLWPDFRGREKEIVAGMEIDETANLIYLPSLAQQEWAASLTQLFPHGLRAVLENIKRFRIEITPVLISFIFVLWEVVKKAVVTMVCAFHRLWIGYEFIYFCTVLFETARRPCGKSTKLSSLHSHFYFYFLPFLETDQRSAMSWAIAKY